MGGVDTIRGIAFQHAYAIQLALDVVEDVDAVALVIEGEADVIDVEIVRNAAPAKGIFQIKSRQEPYQWGPTEVAEVIRKWQDAGGGSGAPLRFVSDAPASLTTITRLKPALAAAGAGALTADEREYLESFGIDVDRAGDASLATRSDSVGAQLAMAESRVRRLLGLAGPVPEDAAERAVDRLFRHFAVEGGEARIERRTFSRTDLAAVLGLDLDLVDRGSMWDASVAAEYQSAIAVEEHPHGLVQLAAMLDPSASVPALALLVRSDDQDDNSTPIPAVDLLRAGHSSGLCGAAGTGKTTTTKQVAAAAANDGATAVVVSVVSYRRGELDRRIRRVLEDAVGRRLAPSATRDALSQADATILIDGVTGLGLEQLDALASDLQETIDGLPNARLVVADRERKFPRRVGLPTYTLAPLDEEQRLAIASSLIDNPANVVADLEHRLYSAIDNPLLFVMALALARVGISPDDRPAIFAGFVEGLRARATHSVAEADLAALRLASIELIRAGRFQADRYWWLAALRESLETIRANGIYEVGDWSAESVLDRLRGLGILFEDDVAAAVSMLHDSFRDYFASVALARREADLPRPVSPEWEEAIALLAEQGGLDSTVSAALANDNPVGAARAALHDRRAPDPAQAGQLTRALAKHLGASPLADCTVAVYSSDEKVYAMAVEDGEDRFVEGEEAQGCARDAMFAVVREAPAGPLILACALWQQALYSITAAEPPQIHRPIPQTREVLVEALTQHFLERQVALRELAARIVPTLAERVVEGARGGGVRGRVGPPESHTVFGNTKTLHPFVYTDGGEEIDISADDKVEGSSGEFRASAIAEFQLDDPPRDVALRDLVKALKALLPERT